MDKETYRKLMLRAGLRNAREVYRECQKLVASKVGSRKYSDSVGLTLAYNLWYGKAKGLSFKQIQLLCDVLKCSPNELFGFEKVVVAERTADERLASLEQSMERLTKMLFANDDVVQTIANIRKGVAAN